jgi:hypothetical protein
MDPQLAAMGGGATTPPFGGEVGVPVPAPPQAEVDDFLRKKRKAREHKVCPCSLFFFAIGYRVFGGLVVVRCGLDWRWNLC